MAKAKPGMGLMDDCFKEKGDTYYWGIEMSVFADDQVLNGRFAISRSEKQH